MNPSSERRIIEETEDEDNDDDEESSESETHTYNDFPSQKSQNSFQVPNKETRKNIRKAETSNSMTITSNTNTAKKSDVSSRLEYSLNLIEATFSDIFVAIEVNSNYQPSDIIEEERSRKRVKDFTCRVGRMLYQAKQNYITLKNAVTKAGFENKATPNIEEKLAQLFVSSKSLLGSYLHFIPLSGGQMFPSIVSDVLDTILDIGHLTASLGFSTKNLSVNVRKLEQVISDQNQKGVNSVSRDILNKIASKTNPSRAQQPVKLRSGRKNVTRQSVIKPKPNKIFQARTNLARMRRMESIGEADSKQTVRQYNFPDLENDKEKVPKSRHSDWEYSGKNFITGDEKKSNNENSDLSVIKRRLHNLELLATSVGKDETNETSDRQASQQCFMKPNENTLDIQFLINRLDIMESDFDLMATKYNLSRSQSTFLALERKKRRSLEDILPNNKTTSSNEMKNKYSGSYSREIVEKIVNRITDEMISKDLNI